VVLATRLGRGVIPAALNGVALVVSTRYIDAIMEIAEDSSSRSAFGNALAVATKLPGVRIDRAAYLRRSLTRHCTEAQILLAVAETPAAAGVSPEILKKVADSAIRNEASKVTALSAAAGLPGGFAMMGSIPADAAQYLAHMLRVAQKLAYLYSWPELFSDKEDEPDDETQNVLTLFVGVMFGVQAANKGVGIVATKLAEQAIKQLPKKALTKGVVYPIVKKVSLQVGAHMTKTVFANGVAKVIPVAGSVLSGGLTLATFVPMSVRLRKHLVGLPPAEVAGSKVADAIS